MLTQVSFVRSKNYHMRTNDSNSSDVLNRVAAPVGNLSSSEVNCKYLNEIVETIRAVLQVETLDECGFNDETRLDVDFPLAFFVSAVRWRAKVGTLQPTRSAVHYTTTTCHFQPRLLKKSLFLHSRQVLANLNNSSEQSELMFKYRKWWVRQWWRIPSSFRPVHPRGIESTGARRWSGWVLVW